MPLLAETLHPFGEVLEGSRSSARAIETQPMTREQTDDNRDTNRTRRESKPDNKKNTRRASIELIIHDHV